MLRLTAYWVTVALIVVLAIRYVPGLWPLIPAVTLYLIWWRAQWRIERDMRRELAVMLSGRG